MEPAFMCGFIARLGPFDIDRLIFFLALCSRHTPLLVRMARGVFTTNCWLFRAKRTLLVIDRRLQMALIFSTGQSHLESVVENPTELSHARMDWSATTKSAQSTCNCVSFHGLWTFLKRERIWGRLRLVARWHFSFWIGSHCCRGFGFGDCALSQRRGRTVRGRGKR